MLPGEAGGRGAVPEQSFQVAFGSGMRWRDSSCTRRRGARGCPVSRGHWSRVTGRVGFEHLFVLIPLVTIPQVTGSQVLAGPGAVKASVAWPLPAPRLLYPPGGETGRQFSVRSGVSKVC